MVKAIQANMSSFSDIQIFDRSVFDQRRPRIAKTFHQYDFLHRWSENQIFESLTLIKRDFKDILVIGGRYSADFFEKLQNQLGKQANIQIYDRDNSFYPKAPFPIVNGDDEVMPFAYESFDLIISNLNFQGVNDLPGVLIQLRKTLKADGLLIGALLGGETLYELRDCLTSAELKLKGGVSPRVHPFATKQDVGALLQRAGYALPVIDSDVMTVTYDNMFKLIQDIRGMGESNIIAKRSRKNPGRQLFFDAAALYADQYHEQDTRRIEASFEIIFVHGWAPDESQQRPLQPGSAAHRLADALGSKEQKV
ncbi:MAG: SAM-dependent methyltransferase [Micavibrio sp.]|nr:SAM-dependent methyltransferase [Micavibrio sp.]|tara:strand:+ start:3603 stop:4529 length:927 start_codon:yes stop_codon:yes gene_type:complete